MSTLELMRLGQLVYPILLTLEAGEISESKAAELLGLPIERIRDVRWQAIQAVLSMVTQLPSPLNLLLESTLAKQKSLTPSV